MKNLLCILLFALFSTKGYGQVVAIQNENGDFLYPCRNSLAIAVSSYPNSSIVVTSNNGKVRKVNGHPGIYTITPYKDTITEIIVKRKTPRGLKFVGKTFFHVRDLPYPILTLSGKKGGSINAAEARVQIAPAASPQGWWCGCGHYQIIAFTLIVIRNEKVVFIKSTANENGCRFRDDSDMERIMTRLRAGDKLIFSGIECSTFYKKTIHLAPMEFTLD